VKRTTEDPLATARPEVGEGATRLVLPHAGSLLASTRVPTDAPRTPGRCVMQSSKQCPGTDRQFSEGNRVASSRARALCPSCCQPLPGRQVRLYWNSASRLQDGAATEDAASECWRNLAAPPLLLPRACAPTQGGGRPHDGAAIFGVPDRAAPAPCCRIGADPRHSLAFFDARRYRQFPCLWMVPRYDELDGSETVSDVRWTVRRRQRRLRLSSW
jgi:hypothetical protein